MKTPTPRSRQLGVIPWLLISMIVVFMMQNIVRISFSAESRIYERAVIEIFGLSTRSILTGKVWTLLTYGFLHSTAGIFHILGNMLGVFFIGRIVSKLFGEKAVLEIFLLATLTGGLVGVGVHLMTSDTRTVIMGASGALMGLLTVFCLSRPNEAVTFLLYFIIPITLKPKWILWGSLAVSTFGLFFYEIPASRQIMGGGGVAHSAHLGGMLGGFLYYGLLSRGKSLSGLLGSFRPQKTTTTPPQQRKKPKISYSVNFGNKDKLKKEVDRILDKINSHGFGALTPEERQTLDKARDILGK